jgi:hypothetical protein
MRTVSLPPEVRGPIEIVIKPKDQWTLEDIRQTPKRRIRVAIQNPNPKFKIEYTLCIGARASDGNRFDSGSSCRGAGWRRKQG